MPVILTWLKTRLDLIFENKSYLYDDYDLIQELGLYSSL
jgi:hypothetical protein